MFVVLLPFGTAEDDGLANDLDCVAVVVVVVAAEVFVEGGPAPGCCVLSGVIDTRRPGDARTCEGKGSDAFVGGVVVVGLTGANKALEEEEDGAEEVVVVVEEVEEEGTFGKAVEGLAVVSGAAVVVVIVMVAVDVVVDADADVVVTGGEGGPGLGWTTAGCSSGCDVVEGEVGGFGCESREGGGGGGKEAARGGREGGGGGRGVWGPSGDEVSASESDLVSERDAFLVMFVFRFFLAQNLRIFAVAEKGRYALWPENVKVAAGYVD